LTADPPAIHGSGTSWMLGRTGEHGASMHGLVAKWVVSGATTMYRMAHAASTRVAAVQCTQGGHPSQLSILWMENKLAISCFPGANSRVPDACKPGCRE
jgi:hypothetical protein